MPTTVAELFAHVDLESEGCVPWGTRPECRSPGVYAVSLSKDPLYSGGLAKPRSCPAAIERWMATATEMTLDDIRPTPCELTEFLGLYWLPDESVLYIGKATELRKRVGQFFSHLLGMGSPHSGGHWLKTLEILEELHVHFAPTATKEEAGCLETAMLERFVSGVSDASRNALASPDLPIPFANLELKSGNKKQTRLKRQRR